ncbi:DUF924 family protein [Reyranella sp.]|uniref:DUF924 family protein n=1 Tax=Reyranella sp. TaxID=1929291 RepID=UPI003BA97D0F
MNAPAIRDVLDFWFLPLDHDDHGKPREAWWKAPEGFDEEIRARFGAAFERAIAGDLATWARSPDGALALILLCDQFPRNMYRRTAQAFAGDATAIEAARLALARGYPAAFNPTMRMFFYMPFQHSEAIGDQELGCALFAAFDDPELMKHAVEHRDVVARFGRFPHRNEVLGRVTTAEEHDYLKDANRFGQ